MVVHSLHLYICWSEGIPGSLVEAIKWSNTGLPQGEVQVVRVCESGAPGGRAWMVTAYMYDRRCVHGLNILLLGTKMIRVLSANIRRRTAVCSHQ